MNTEDMLTDLFAAQADRRPEAAAVLDAVHERIARQRRVTVTRAASALSAAAAVAAVAVTTSVITAPSGHRADPAGGAAPSAAASSAPPLPSATRRAAPIPSATDPTTPRPRSSAPTVSRSGGTRNYSTINAGYLPGPAKQDPAGTSNQPGFEERDWDVTVDGVAMDVIIWTEEGSLPSRMQATGGQSNYRAIRINGHLGRMFASSNITIVAFELGNGTTAYAGPSVRHTTGTVTTARITAIAVKVARNMHFNQHDPIPDR